MGIKHFYSWFRKHDALKKSISQSVPGDVDHLLIDMNGVIHEAAQRVYKYGKYAPKKTGVIIPRRRQKAQKTKPQTKIGPSIKDLYECVKSDACPQIAFIVVIASDPLHQFVLSLARNRVVRYDDRYLVLRYDPLPLVEVLGQIPHEIGAGRDAG